jgi:aminoglycoside 3-N-acetyltransferase
VNEKRVVSIQEIIESLRAIGVQEGDNLAVHSSLHSLGWVDGGANGVVDALMQTLTPNGTLLMPTMNRREPVWLHAQTPSKVGKITEVFRTMEGVCRSIHPTHSVAAWGKRAGEFVEGHPAASALGVDSPFHRLSKAGGKVLMIGVTYTTCSMIHVAEAIAKVPYMGIFYPGYELPLLARLANGMELTFHPFENPGDSSCFQVVERRLEADGRLTLGRIGQARSTLALGRDVLTASMECLRDNPFSLVYNDKLGISEVLTASIKCIKDNNWKLDYMPQVD